LNEPSPEEETRAWMEQSIVGIEGLSSGLKLEELEFVQELDFERPDPN
jgi:hypothetical protein